MPIFQTITDLVSVAETLKRRPYGVIEIVDGSFSQVRLRPFPKLVSVPDILLFGNGYHGRTQGDRFWLYYNQPLRHRNFLVLKYVVSARETSFGSLAKALDVLDYIAKLKRSDALLCDAFNWRISDKIFGRWGWEKHCPSRWHRHYIKRFYGTYPPLAKWLLPSEITNSACVLASTFK